MGRCRDCRWWSGSPGERRALCQKLVTVGFLSTGLAPDSATVAGIQVKGIQAIVTGPDFGCVQFEAQG